jgi:hypothetical protein
MAYQYWIVPDGQQGSLDDKGVRRYTIKYLVYTDNAADDAGLVATYVPTVMFQSYSTTLFTDPYCILKRKSAERVEGQLHFWIVTNEFDSEPIELNSQSSAPGDSGNNVTPTARPWLVSFDSENQDKIMPKDLNNLDVVNSAGQPFDPPLTVPCAYPTITITGYKTLASDNFTNCANYVNTVNNAVWQGFAAKKCKCLKYQLQQEYENGAFWWKKTVVIQVHPDSTWNPVKILDCGTYEVFSSSAGQKYRQIPDHTGAPVTSPVPLDGTGHALQPGNPLVYKDFQAYREVNWAAII